MIRYPIEIGAFVVAFAAYALMCAPGVTWMDSGELAAAAYTLGGAHPPGHPLHSLLGKLATLVPIGEIGFRIALLSAASMAAAVAGCVALARALVKPAPVALVAIAVLAILAPVPQVNATRVEVYGPAAALVVWAMVCAVRYVRAPAGERHLRPALLCAFLCALAAAVHPLIAAAAALPMAIAIAARTPLPRLPRLAAASVALGLLGLAVYLYLPVRASAATPPLLMWGQPDSAGALFDLIRAPAYQGNFELAGWPARLAGLMVLLGEGFGLGLLFGGLIGLSFAAMTGLRGALLPLGGALAVLAAAATQSYANPDMPGYVLPALLFLAAGTAPLFEAVARVLPDASQDWRWRNATAAVLALPLIAVGAAAPEARATGSGFRRGDAPLRLWSDTVALTPPGPALYFATGDHGLFPAQYERLVAGGRPDVAVASPELARDAWFLRHVKRLGPELYVPYVDDGIAGNIAERLAVSNLRQGRPVAASVPSFGRLASTHAAAIGRAYLLRLEPADALGPALPPPPFRGPIGSRVAGEIGLTRALYEAERGRIAEGARAAGLEDRFGPEGMAALASARPSAERPALYGLLPRLGPVFIFGPWQREVLGDDFAWVAGLPDAELEADAPASRLLHARWRALLRGELDPDQAIEGLGPEAALATARMLAVTRRLEAADQVLRDLLARDESAEALVLHGMVLDRAGRSDEARAAWSRALELEPGRTDAAALLEPR